MLTPSQGLPQPLPGPVLRPQGHREHCHGQVEWFIIPVRPPWSGDRVGQVAGLCGQAGAQSGR